MSKSIGFLVVDDEPHLEFLLAQKFRHKIRSGVYRFYFAQHGHDALEILLENDNIELVITDINMPCMDGLTLLKHIKKDFPHVKTMIMSAYVDDESQDEARKAGAVEFITKPIRLSVLDKVISNMA